MDMILKYYPELTAKQAEQIRKLETLYKEWNRKINVISRRDLEHLYEHHILHSLSIANIIRFKNGTSIMDVGTGGGLPGIPLAIYFPESRFYLVDSVGKKIKVVKAISERLNLKNIKAEHIRAEKTEGRFDFILSRAVTNLPSLYGWVKNKVKKECKNDLPNGLIVMKGGDISEEIKPFKGRVRIWNLEDYFSEEYFKEKKIVFLEI